MARTNFREAVVDYRYLRNRGFPEKACLKIVGDRYRLSRIERNSLFRGVVEDTKRVERLAKLISAHDVRNDRLGIDWYNVLITVESYLRGTPVFVADDGVVRDPSGTHSSFRAGAITDRAVGEIAVALNELEPREAAVFVDSPVSHSADMVSFIRLQIGTHALFPLFVSLSRSADFPLKTFGGIVATSDSVILDSATRVFDLPRHILNTAFGYDPVPVEEITDTARGKSG